MTADRAPEGAGVWGRLRPHRDRAPEGAGVWGRLRPHRDRAPKGAVGCIALGVVAAALATGCGDRQRDPKGLGDAPSGAASASVAAPTPSSRVHFSFLAELPRCDIDHGGQVLDGGTPALAPRYGWTGHVPPGVTDVEHDGSTWARVADRSVDFVVAVTRQTPLFVSARAQGKGAKSAQVSIDDQPLGTLNFGRDLIKVATTGTTALPVDPGLHTISLRFFGRSRDEAAFADLDWIRVGVPEELTETYGAPTLRDLVAPAAAIAGTPHKSLAVRAPGSVRCTLRLPRSAVLSTWIGLQGDGAGDAEVRVLADGKPTQVVQTIHVESGPASRWILLERPLAEYGTGVVGIELMATHTSKGSRVLFGDPEILLAKTPPPPVPAARAVVVVVLDGVERRELPPWSASASPLLPNLQDLATSATTFERHRGPSTVVASVVASLLTARPPRVHGLVDSGARLPVGNDTLASVARAASVRTAMFTGVPTTFRPFGFGEGWEKFVEFAPTGGDPASAPFDAAATWLTEVARGPGEPRMLVVIHARGGHPPWDVKDLGNLPPKDYAGLVEPRRAAQILARLRRRRARDPLSDADRTRMQALEQIALGGQDRALGGLVTALRTANLWDHTLFVVTGDVSSGVSDQWLYGDGLDLKEPLLTLPLYVHFPGGLHAGRRVGDGTEIYDVSRTALAALGLSFARPPQGRDLAQVGSEVDAGAVGPAVATVGDKYAARWGDLVLSGRFPRPPELCDLALDAACAFNRRDVTPLATLAIFHRLVLGDAAGHGPVDKREPATLDADIQAQLAVWGQD